MATGTEDTLKARVPEWVYKECKKIGAKKKEGKAETKTPSSSPTKTRRLNKTSGRSKKKS